MNMDEMDFKMDMLAGSDIFVDGIPIKPFTLKEIKETKFSNFQQSVNILTISVDDFINQIEDFELQAMYKAEKSKIKAFDLYYAIPEYRKAMLESFKLLLRHDNIEEVINDKNEPAYMMVPENHEINRDNFDKISKTIIFQNSPPSSEEEDEDDNINSDDEEVRAMAEKLKKLKEKVKKSKEMDSDEEGSGINLISVISAVTAMSNTINKFNVWDLTLYQLYDEFSRLSRIEDYRFMMQASMFASDIEISHWAE